MANKNSKGSDGITAWELKQFKNELLLPLTLLFNMSLADGVFPKCFKNASITPVPKIPKPRIPVDYRPIAILPTVSKVFEAIIQMRMINFLLKQNFFSKNQFGFLPQRSTSDALVAHLKEIVDNFEKKKKVIELYLDLSKAFDSVNHSILLRKLERAGFRSDFHRWLASYLENRQQCVRSAGTSSEMLHVVCGVPQESTLGPLLFLILYVNSVLNLQLHGPVFSFADDTAIVYSAATVTKAKEKCEADLGKLSEWFLFHEICPNLNKTQVIEYNYKRPGTEFPSIIWHLQNCDKTPCNCTVLKKVDDTKYLGVYLNSNLNWNSHSNYLQTKLRKLNYLMYYLKNSIPTKIKRRIYLALYEPVLAYGIECWGGTADYIQQPIKVLQKGAIRAVAGARYREHTAPIFSSLAILSYSNLYARALVSLVHRGVITLFKNSGVNLRRTTYKTSQWKNKKARIQPSYQTPIHCSKLPPELQAFFGHPSFPKKIRKYLLGKQN